jgi:hypothetical protein
MPSWLTHFAVVTKTFEKLNSSWKEVLIRNPSYAFLGGIYADIYYASIMPFSKRWSDMMHHEKTGEFACKLLINSRDEKFGKKREKDKERAFALGYVTHIAADITIHPFTTKIVKESSDVIQNAEHARCELHQDSYIYYECESSLFSDCEMWKYIEIPDMDRGDAFFRKFPAFLVKLVRESHNEVYGENPSAIEVELSYLGAVYALNTQVVISSREIDRRCIENGEENFKKRFEESVKVSSDFLKLACEFLDGSIGDKELRSVILDWNLDNGEVL